MAVRQVSADGCGEAPVNKSEVKGFDSCKSAGIVEVASLTRLNESAPRHCYHAVGLANWSAFGRALPKQA